MKNSRRYISDREFPFLEKSKDHILFGVFMLIGITTLLFGANMRDVFSGRILSLYQGVFSEIHFIIKDKINATRTLAQIRSEHETLLETVSLQQLIYQNPESSVRQLEILKESVHIRQQFQFNSIIAQIIARDPDQHLISFVIDKGAEDGLVSDMVVVAIQEGSIGLIGRIRSTTQKSAKVQTILDSKNFVAAKVQKNNLDGILQGDFNVYRQETEKQKATLQFIDGRDIDEVEFGDLVVTSGLSSIYYPEIPIGNIINISSENYQQTLQIEIEPIVNFNTLQYVLVIIPGSA